MTALERILIGLVVGALLARRFEFAPGALNFALVAVLVVLALLAVTLNPARWQMYPAYIVAAALAGITLSGVEPTGIMKQAELIGGLLFAAAASMLAVGLPLPTLPAPRGIHAVGVVSLELERPVDTSDGSAGGRRLFVKAWYPADVAQLAPERETLWSELYEPGWFPAPVRMLSRYLRKVRTHSFLSAPVATQAAPFSVLIYSHSLVSIASENTLLMEQLASDGFIVVSVRHIDQHAEYAEIRNSVPLSETAHDRELYRKLSGGLERSERARLSQELYDSSSGMPVIVERRTQDARFVVDNLGLLLAAIPGCADGECAVASRYGALGLSLGGAVATRLCAVDPRCLAVANLDGGLYGVDEVSAVRVPYLMLYSERNEGGNDALRNAVGGLYSERTFVGAKHLDFHDAPIVTPGLRWTGALGDVKGRDVNRAKNDAVSSFFVDAFRRRPVN